MSSPFERLEAIIKSHSPSEVKFQHTREHGSIVFTPKAVKQITYVKIDDPLQELMRFQVGETFDEGTSKFYINTEPETMFYAIRNQVLENYRSYSKKCPATKRKTESFVRGVKLEDKHLANYIISLFITCNTSEFEGGNAENKYQFFEPLESLRRVYGKRS